MAKKYEIKVEVGFTKKEIDRIVNGLFSYFSDDFDKKDIKETGIDLKVEKDKIRKSSKFIKTLKDSLGNMKEEDDYYLITEAVYNIFSDNINNLEDKISAYLDKKYEKENTEREANATKRAIKENIAFLKKQGYTVKKG